LAMVVANIGPGAITPDRETKATIPRNNRTSSVPLTFQLKADQVINSYKSRLSMAASHIPQLDPVDVLPGFDLAHAHLIDIDHHHTMDVSVQYLIARHLRIGVVHVAIALHR